jgi:hypothetical protein
VTAGGAAEQGPRVRVTTVGEATPQEPHQWQVRWELVNETDQLLLISSAWLPHARFRSDPVDYDPPLAVEGGGRLRLQFNATVDGEGGPLVENGFILLRTTWEEERWRIFVRVRVTLDDAGRPLPSTQAIQTQLIVSED